MNIRAVEWIGILIAGAVLALLIAWLFPGWIGNFVVEKGF